MLSVHINKCYGFNCVQRIIWVDDGHGLKIKVKIQWYCGVSNYYDMFIICCNVVQTHNIFVNFCFLNFRFFHFNEFIFRLFMCSTNFMIFAMNRTVLPLMLLKSVSNECRVTLGVFVWFTEKKNFCLVFRMWVKRKRSYFIRIESLCWWNRKRIVCATTKK